MADAYARNSAHVEAALDRLRELPPPGWNRLEDAHTRAKTIDAAQEALAGVLASERLYRPINWRPASAACGTQCRRGCATWPMRRR